MSDIKSPISIAEFTLLLDGWGGEVDAGFEGEEVIVLRVRCDVEATVEVWIDCFIVANAFVKDLVENMLLGELRASFGVGSWRASEDRKKSRSLLVACPSSIPPKASLF